MTDKNENNDNNEKLKNLNKAFFAINDLVMKPIDLSRFNGPEGMFAKAISMEDFQAISKECTVLRGGVDPVEAKAEDYEFSDDFVACTIAASVCDVEGNLVFGEDEIPAIQKKSKVLFDIVSEVVTEMNTIIKDKEVDTTAKK